MGWRSIWFVVVLAGCVGETEVDLSASRIEEIFKYEEMNNATVIDSQNFVLISNERNAAQKLLLSLVPVQASRRESRVFSGIWGAVVFHAGNAPISVVIWPPDDSSDVIKFQIGNRLYFGGSASRFKEVSSTFQSSRRTTIIERVPIPPENDDKH